MPEGSSNIWNLIKSVVLPVDIDELWKVYSDISDDVKETSWLQLLYRLEGISMLILLPGVAILSGLLVYESDISISDVQTIGVPYAVGLGIVAILMILKGIVWTVDRVNQGKSIWGDDSNNIGIGFAIRIITSSAFLIAPFYAIVGFGVSLRTTLTLFILFCVLLGSLIIGFSGVFSSIIVLQMEDADDS